MTKISLKFATLMVVLALSVVTSAIAQPTDWQQKAKEFYANCNCDRPPTRGTSHMASRTQLMSAGATGQATPDQLVSISTNTGRFASLGAPVQVRVDIARSYLGPVNVFGRFQMRRNSEQYRVINYFVPEGTLFGHYDKLDNGGFVAVNVVMPTGFGDQMLFDVVVTDPQGNLLDQQYTEVTFGGVSDGGENYFHIDHVSTLGNGLVGITGRFPVGTPIAVKFGDNRSNSSGLVFVQAIDDQNLVLPYKPQMGVPYSFGMDATVCFFHQCYTVPNGLVFNGPNITPKP